MHAKGQTGQKIKEVFEQFVGGIPPECMIDLDPKRGFSDDDKHAIKLACGGKCSRCGQPVLDGDAAYHHKEARRRGGGRSSRTALLMHQKCHLITHEVDPVRVDASFQSETEAGSKTRIGCRLRAGRHRVVEPHLQAPQSTPMPSFDASC